MKTSLFAKLAVWVMASPFIPSVLEHSMVQRFPGMCHRLTKPAIETFSNVQKFSNIKLYSKVMKNQQPMTRYHRYYESPILDRKPEIKRDIKINLMGDTANTLNQDLSEIQAAMDKMAEEAEQIFGLFRDQKPSLAGQRMATMDRYYARVNCSCESGICNDGSRHS